MAKFCSGYSDFYHYFNIFAYDLNKLENNGKSICLKENLLINKNR